MEAVKILRAVAVLGLALASYRLVRRWWMRRLMGQRVAGKVVLITGASSGLGEGTSSACCAWLCVCVCTSLPLCSIGKSLPCGRGKGHPGR